MPGLPTQNIPIPFAQGVTTKVDPKQAPLGKLLTLENGMFQTPLEIRKRYGFTALSQNIMGGGTLDNSAGLFKFNDELLQYSQSNATTARGGRMYGYDVGNSAWVSVGAFYGMKLTTQPVSSAEVTQFAPDGTYDSASGLKCFAWTQVGPVTATNDLYASIIDETTGKTVFSGALATNISGGLNTSVRVVIFNSNFVIIYSTSTDILYIRIATSAPTAIAGTGTIVTAIRGIDALVVGSRLYVAYCDGSGTGIAIVYLDTSWVVSSPASSLDAGLLGAVQSIGMCSDSSNNIAVVLGTSSRAYAAVFDSNLGVVLAITILAPAGTFNVVRLGVVSLNNVFHAYMSTSTPRIVYARFTTSSVTTDITIFQERTALVSRPWVYGGNIFLCGMPDVAYQYALMVYTHYADCDDSRPACVVGKAAYSTYSWRSLGDNDNIRIAPSVFQMSSGVYQLAFSQQTGVIRTAVASSSSDSPGNTWALTLDLTVTPNSAQIANSLHLSGGQLWQYDGMNILEHGFHFYPYIYGATAGTTGSIANGTYQYVVVYEWTDAFGQVHRSSPSAPTSVTLAGANDSLALEIKTLTATNKRGIATTGTIRPTNKVKCCVYRTTTLGTVFYFVGSIDNDVTADLVTYTDTSADADIILNIQLYTTGGQVENTGAPACTAVATYKSRLVLIPSDNPFSWWFSQEVIPDSEATSSTPVEMSDLFIQNIDQKGGPLTGILSMDDKLILMKRDLPYYVVGHGPAPNGANNDYSPPQEITAPVGTVLANSMMLSPLGIIFQAANSAGMWLLDRSLSLSYIGSDVEAYNSQSVTSAALYPQYNQVRFTMSGGVALVFDYFVQQWTVYTNVAAVQAAVWRGNYTYMRSTGLALQESTATFTDNGTFVQLKIGTSWMKFAGLQGFQRIYEAQILGDYQSAHSLIAKVYYDFNPAVTQTTTITPTSSAPYQWRLQFKRQKCEAMKIELYDTQVSPAEGMRLSALTLVAGIKYGLNKMSAGRTFD